MNPIKKSSNPIRPRREKIIFLSAKNPLDKTEWSGIPYFMYKSLQQHFEVELMKGLKLRIIKKIGHYISQLSEKVFGKKFAFDYGILISLLYGIYYSARLLRKKNIRFIFCPAGLHELAFIQTKIPIISAGDCSTLQLVGYYPSLRNVHSVSIKEIAWVEKNAFSKIRLQLFSSRWAANFTHCHYGFSNIVDVAFGSNIFPKSSVEKMISLKKTIPFQLTFISLDWYRKGGDIVLDTVNVLISMRVPIHLTIIGCRPPNDFDRNHITIIEHLDKNAYGEIQTLENILLSTHLVLLPTRADCTPIVVAEAFAFGIPVLASKTGGLPSMITDDINGYLFEINEAGYYANKILEIFEDPMLYSRLALSSLNTSKEILNWEAWASTGINAINKVL